MTDISEFVPQVDEFTEMRTQISFEREGIKNSLVNRIGIVNDTAERGIPCTQNGMRLLKTQVATIFSLLEKLEDCDFRVDGINEAERIQRKSQA
jgi:MoaA/NifB/PqqE/SkfB family radical SAM enzyme